MTAEQLAAFRELVAELTARVMPDLFPDRPSEFDPATFRARHRSGWRSRYDLARERCEAAFGISDRFISADGRAAGDRLLAAAYRRRRAAVVKHGHGATEARARDLARQHIRSDVERGYGDDQIASGHHGSFGDDCVVVGGAWCAVHQKGCFKAGSVFVFRINGDPCCYRFTIAALRKEILAPPAPQQLSLFGEVA